MKCYWVMSLMLLMAGSSARPERVAALSYQPTGMAAAPFYYCYALSADSNTFYYSSVQQIDTSIVLTSSMEQMFKAFMQNHYGNIATASCVATVTEEEGHTRQDAQKTQMQKVMPNLVAVPEWTQTAQ